MAVQLELDINGHANGKGSHHDDDDQHDEELLRAAAQADNQNQQPSPSQSTSAPPTIPDSSSMARSGSSKARNAAQDVEPAVHEERFNKLKFLLQRSGVYSRIMGEKMEKERKARAEAAAKQEAKRNAATTLDTASAESQPAPPVRKTRSAVNANDQSSAPPTTTERDTRRRDTRKRKPDQDHSVTTYLNQDDLEAAKEQADQANKKPKIDAPHIADTKQNNANESGRRNQPKLVTGAKMREYQLDGLEWLISLYENGLNGILADEMGLGKTLQTISFLAHLREKGVWGPFLVVAPLSTINNWVLEFERFTPDIPALMYHGDPDVRRELRDRHLRMPRDKEKQKDFPIVVTSYELVIRDRKWLANYPWKFIVVDEGHRLKNLNCRLIRELKTYRSANRLILSGTPLHNNLAELWSLLNFILPDIFDDLATFETWFDFSDIHEEHGQSRILSKENSSQVITQLHEILKPFLLRRLKNDVETDLPPKKEYLLYAPLTELQRELYNSVVGGTIRRWLLERKTGLPWNMIQDILDDPDGINTASSSAPTTRIGSADQSRDQSPHPWAVATKRLDIHAKIKEDEIPQKKRGPGRPRKSEPTKASRSSSADYHLDTEEHSATGRSTPRQQTNRRAKRGINYVDELNDDKYFNMLEEELNRAPKRLSAAQAERQGKLFSIREAQKQIKNMHLENVVMQARKICNHPFLFDWPVDKDSGQLVVNKDLINASGKMLMLNRLLDELFHRGHKVLIFSQFTTMLDIIEEWANEFKGFRTCRIDGTTPQDERRAQMKSFNEDKGKDACNLFLLSTRAGGLGINLVAADTVIFYDSDWNPQMDLQAQDRVHRIGQTRPCLIFRLVSASTVEERILKRAGNKRKLEALVIQQGKFRLPAGYQSSLSGAKKKKEDELNDITNQLLALESEQITLVKDENDQIISDNDLDLLLDRSKEAYERKLGWVSNNHGDDPRKPGRKTKVGRSAFEVTETKTDEANEEIAKLLAGN
ncbi:related to proliferation associated SNF2-like protein [Melanopsichium pennsylvanicum]|uniref:Related to proliferation associated SNF2-like protein n=2 Tax=Melanopsichium pennsylvanicum TaxID=63383 RepID=A0AAJ5C6Y4_9BASI|nr:related to proliferation associated SNF2-like protein [Melanopsichium pennsylvanicum 4]SNX86342.1 related to proliferation associated SNF2-like protein [Melanopsichium pennsylvanicum]